MKKNNFIVFTKDLPSIEGSGKSIRLMNWLAYLAQEYDKVYCIYFYTNQTESKIKEKTPDNIVFMPVHLNTTNRIVSFYRRSIAGFFKPNRYSFFWYKKIKQADDQIIQNLLKTADAILIYRLYLFPVLIKYFDIDTHIKNIAIDMDDAESETFDQSRRAQWVQGDYTKWLISSIGLYYMNYYEKHVTSQVSKLYYSHPADVIKYKANYRDKNIVHFANKVPYALWADKLIDTQECNLLFVGTLNYYPNEDAIYLLIGSIWPKILKQKKNATLTIAGSKPSNKLRKLITGAESVRLIENPEVMKDVFQTATLLIVPLRIGGGTRIKIMQAFSFGIPVISTSIGVSGIDLVHNETGKITDSVTDMVSSCLDLLSNPAERNRIAKNAYAYFIDNHSFKI